MADRVDTLDVFSGKEKLIRRLTNVSDGTGETNVAKVTKSGLVAWSGNAPSKLGIYMIQWSIQGFSSIELDWDHTTADEIAVLAAGAGMRLFGQTPGIDSGVLWDPFSAGGTGNLILTTRGAVANATYDILIGLRLTP